MMEDLNSSLKTDNNEKIKEMKKMMEKTTIKEWKEIWYGYLSIYFNKIIY